MQIITETRCRIHIRAHINVYKSQLVASCCNDCVKAGRNALQSHFDSVSLRFQNKTNFILKMKNGAFGSLTLTLTYQTRKTSETQLRWFQICLAGAVVTVQLHRLREGNGPEMRACRINYGRVMSLTWSILSRTMTRQSQKESKRSSSFLAWVWKYVLCKANLMKWSLLYIKGAYLRPV